MRRRMRASPWVGVAGQVRRELLSRADVRGDPVARDQAMRAALDPEFVALAHTRGIKAAAREIPRRFPPRPVRGARGVGRERKEVGGGNEGR